VLKYVTAQKEPLDHLVRLVLKLEVIFSYELLA